jgi:hypothetical protein
MSPLFAEVPVKKRLVSIKHLLNSLGRRLPKRYLTDLQAALNYMHAGRWMRDHGFEFKSRVQNREAVWAACVDQVKLKRVLYLEFGVASGRSIQYWSEHLINPESQLHGFDSFEGLPESGGPWVKGQFATGGAVPMVDDKRVRFFKGWFDAVLPTYTLPPHDVLVINIDVDLYSSAICVLRFMRPHIRPGTFIYFDEMNHPEHEQRAFHEFLEESRLRFRSVISDKTLAAVLFECVGLPSDRSSQASDTQNQPRYGTR